MKKLKFTLLVLLFTVFTGFSASAIIIPPGPITGRLTAGYYTIPAGSVFVPAGNTLIIEPGVKIYFAPNVVLSTGPGSNLIIMDSTEFVMSTMARFDIKGDFFVFGKPGREAYFHDALIPGGKWLGINFVTCNTDTVSINYAKIVNAYKYAGGGVPRQAGAICAHQSTFDIFAVHHTLFQGNDALLDGGAVFFNLSHCNTGLLFADNVFEQNNAKGSGGAVFLDVQNTDVKFLHNTFTQNTAGAGGAIYVRNGMGSIMGFDMNDFAKNEANDYGGAFFFTGDVDEVVVSRNGFYGNTAHVFDGGAIYSAGFNHINPLTIMLNVFDGNTAKLGGAVCTANDNGHDKNYFNNLFVHNYASTEGGAVWCERQYAFVNNTFSENSTTGGNAGAIYAQYLLPAPGGISNNILWGDIPNETNNVLSVGNAYPDFFFCDIDGIVGAGGAGCINANPLFVAPGDYHIAAGSPCIDTGDPAFVPGAHYPFWTTDLDFTARVKGTAVDMGAYEYLTPPPSHPAVIHLLKPEESSGDLNVRIYPNPAVDKVNVSIEGEVENDINIEVYDLTGKRIMNSHNSMQDSNITLDISPIPAGIYLMKIESGNEHFSKRLIIK